MKTMPLAQATPTQLEALKAGIRTALDALYAEAPETAVAVVSMSDGRVLQSRFRTPRNADRVGAVVSSLLAIAEAASRELAAGACRQALISTEALNVFVVRVGGAGSPFVLAAAFDEAMMIGSSLHDVRVCATRIAEAIATALPDVAD